MTEQSQVGVDGVIFSPFERCQERRAKRISFTTMIDALRRRAETHTLSGNIHDAGESTSFLGLTSPPYGGLFITPTDAIERNKRSCGNMGRTLGGHGERGFMNCFFWCAQTGRSDDGDETEDEEDPAVGLTEVSPSCSIRLDNTSSANRKHRSTRYIMVVSRKSSPCFNRGWDFKQRPHHKRTTPN